LTLNDFELGTFDWITNIALYGRVTEAAGVEDWRMVGIVVARG